MPTPKDIDTFYPKSQKEWREWLKKNHNTKTSIWLVQYKKASGKATIGWSEAVDEALCFGWIDSTRKTLDSESFIQYFGRRKPGSTWSKINKEKVERLIEKKLMTKAGLACIETAKQNGSWNILDTVEELLVPAALEKAFKAHPGSKLYFESLSKSVKKMILHRIAMAKQDETKAKRIKEIAESAAKKQKPKGI